jgi:hypothetical protein
MSYRGVMCGNLRCVCPVDRAVMMAFGLYGNRGARLNTGAIDGAQDRGSRRAYQRRCQSGSDDSSVPTCHDPSIAWAVPIDPFA